VLEESLLDLRHTLRLVFEDRMPQLRLDWAISDRTISEVGGRLIEDFVLQKITGAVARLPDRRSQGLEVVVPTTGRTVEDFRLLCTHNGGHIDLLVDVKGHNQHRRGSRPNLASIRKCVELYADPNRSNEEIVLFFCRYEPRTNHSQSGTELTYDVIPRSFDDLHVIPLRWLSRTNLDPANIGSGGQILLAREDSLAIERRSRAEFVDLLCSLQERLRRQSANPALNAGARDEAARAD
jgi:hypothetical protein